MSHITTDRHGPGQIAAHAQHAEQHQAYAFIRLHNDLSPVPELKVFSRGGGDGLRGGCRGGA